MAGRFAAHQDRYQPDSCPEAEAFDPALRALSVAQLEDWVIHGGLLPPSSGRRQLEALRAALSAYPLARRACMYRVMLMQTAATSQSLLSSPEHWGVDLPSEEIAARFLSLPLLDDWDQAQRRDVLDQVDEHVLPSLHQEDDTDREHWRRMYFALLLRTHVTESALVALGTTRPQSGLNFHPRFGRPS